MLKISSRASGMEPSATLAVVAKAKILKAQGKQVISFGAGEPDFDSPRGAIRYAETAIREGKTHYTPSNGIPELREAVKTYYVDRFGLNVKTSQVIIGAGAKPLIYEALASIIDPGDEVIVFSPAWVSYVEQIRLLGGREAIVDTTATGCIPDPVMAARAVNHKTAAILINAPNDPTGAVYGEETLRQIASIAVQNDLWIIFDEIYERLTYGTASHSNLLSVFPEAAERTILINGVSKAFAMTGWRIGYAIAPESVAEKIGAVQGHLTSNPCSIAQWAALGALREGEPEVVKMRAEFSKRLQLMADFLSRMPHISFSRPSGAFYVFVDISRTIGGSYKGHTINSDGDFCEALLDSEYVAAVPGTAFVAPGYIRLAYANSEEEITEGMRRLHLFLDSIDLQ